MKKLKAKQNGQALLVVILISTVLLTIGLSMINLTRDEIKISELENESKRAFSAAEAGIDAAIRLTPGASVNIGGLGLGSDIGGTATIDTATSNSFTTPLLVKDGQYTFYLTGFNPNTGTVINAAFNDNISLTRTLPTGTYCGTTQEFAVELTFASIDDNNDNDNDHNGNNNDNDPDDEDDNNDSDNDGIVTRRLIDECDLIDGTTNEEIDFGTNVNTSTFSNDPQILFAHIIAPNAAFSGAKLTFANVNHNWPLQGKTVTSTAQTGAGVAKKVQLFQSYPQIPSEFFATSF